jgi:hypothetical protein
MGRNFLDYYDIEDFEFLHTIEANEITVK